MAQPSMRRCSLLPISDSVGGAIGFKIFEQVEQSLKKSNWCTYVSNSGLINIFSKYRENLPQHLKTKEVLATVSEKLKVGSLIGVVIRSELGGVEIEMSVYGSDGEDLYFYEKTSIQGDEIEEIFNVIKTWLDLYSKVIPYDAKINGILGDQVTIDVGKGYPISSGQDFVVKRVKNKKRHPLLKKIVDWDVEVLANGKIFNISDNQALGQIKNYKTDKKLSVGDWVRLEPVKSEIFEDQASQEKANEEPGTLGILSMAFFGSSASVDTLTPSGSNRMAGRLYGIDVRAEGWLTREYFGAIEIEKSTGGLEKKSGPTQKSEINSSNSSYKFSAGYKYLPIGFFYGPQIDIYGGYASHSVDLDISQADGFGKSSITGILLGSSVNVPINREYRFNARAEFMPFPNFKDEDKMYGTAKTTSSLELEVGGKYQYTPRITIDAGLETLSRKAKFKTGYREISYKDNRLKLGVSFNF